MRIFYDGCIFYRQKYGGINVVFREIFKRLSKFSEIECAVTFPFHNQCSDINSIKKFIIPKIRPNRFYPYVWKTMNDFYFSHYHPDIFHSTYYSAPKRKEKIKKVLTVHDMIYETFTEFFPSKESRAFVDLKSKSILDADAIVCVSESTKKDILKFHPGVDVSKLSVIYNGFENSYCRGVTVEEKHNFMHQGGLKRPFLLYVGTTCPGYKNFDLLLDSYVSSPDIHEKVDLVVITSDCFTDKQIKIFSRIKERVKRFSYIDTFNLHMFYSCAEIFVYPSKYEGFGIPILEAMASGTPVIASNVSSIPEVGGEGALYFDPYSKNDLCNQILHVMNDFKLKTTLINKGHKNIQRFSWDMTVENLLKVYRRLK